METITNSKQIAQEMGYSPSVYARNIVEGKEVLLAGKKADFLHEGWHQDDLIPVGKIKKGFEHLEYFPPKQYQHLPIISLYTYINAHMFKEPPAKAPF